jgi:hypothetical protein
VLGYRDTKNYLLIKFRDNGAGMFHQVSFYYADTDAGWAGMTGGADNESIPLAMWFTRARVTAELDHLTRDVTVSIDVGDEFGAFDDVPELTLTRGNAPASLGVQIGLGGFGPARMDNLQKYADSAPEPATLVLLGLGTLLFRRRRRG